MWSETSLTQVFRVLDAVAAIGCPHWVSGGWGIDALVGRQTRPHGDLDLDVIGVREDAVIAVLGELGYVERLDQRPTRIELGHPDGSCVDLHPLILLPDGGAKQIAPDGSAWSFEAEWFTVGSLDGRPVPTYTEAGHRHFHTGYELRPVDRVDLDTLDRFAAEPPSA